jgi:hypothetical protein
MGTYFTAYNEKLNLLFYEISRMGTIESYVKRSEMYNDCDEDFLVIKF